MESQSTKIYHALVIGATGATGRELVDHLLKSEFYSTVTVLARRELEKWKNLPEEQSKKLKCIITEDIGIIAQDKDNLNKLFSDKTFTNVFCCLGSRVGNGDAEFKKVDYDYVVNSAEICEKLDIPYFGEISSGGVDPKSWFLYMRVKGQADEAVLKKNIKHVSVFRPGAITNRENDERFVDKFMKYIPFIPKIKSTDLAMAMYNDSMIYNTKPTDGKIIITHSQILKLY